MPKCVVCQKKPARIGKKQGYDHNLICSAKCALDDFMMRQMDLEFCNDCNQWIPCCTCICEEHNAPKATCACPIKGE